MHHRKPAFSLMELMVVIAIIGILATIAVPAYRNYMIRANIGSLIAETQVYMTKISDYYNQNQQWPSNFSDIGLVDSSSLQSIGIPTIHLNQPGDGIGKGWFGFYADLNKLNVPVIGPGLLILYKPTVANSIISWQCGIAGSANREPYLQYMPANCQNVWYSFGDLPTT